MASPARRVIGQKWPRKLPTPSRTGHKIPSGGDRKASTLLRGWSRGGHAWGGGPHLWGPCLGKEICCPEEQKVPGSWDPGTAGEKVEDRFIGRPVAGQSGRQGKRPLSSEVGQDTQQIVEEGAMEADLLCHQRRTIEPRPEGLSCQIWLKGTVSRDFLILVFSMNQFPPSPWVYH